MAKRPWPLSTTSAPRGSRPARSGRPALRFWKAGISTPGLIACGLRIQLRRLSGVLSTTPAPSVARPPTWVRSGPTLCRSSPDRGWRGRPSTCSAETPARRASRTASPAAAAAAAQALNWSAGSATTRMRIQACCSPQYWLQVPSYMPRPIDQDRHLVRLAGHRVLHPAKLRHVKAVDHVDRLQADLQRRARPARAARWPSTTCWSGYWYSHHHWWPMTRSGCAPGCGGVHRTHRLDDQHEHHRQRSAPA